MTTYLQQLVMSGRVRGMPNTSMPLGKTVRTPQSKDCAVNVHREKGRGRASQSGKVRERERER